MRDEGRYFGSRFSEREITGLEVLEHRDLETRVDVARCRQRFHFHVPRQARCMQAAVGRRGRYAIGHSITGAGAHPKCTRALERCIGVRHR